MDMTIASRFRNNAKTNPDKIAIHTREEYVTYLALDKKTDTVAGALLKYNCANSDTSPPKIAILMSNKIEFIEVLLGSAKAGWLTVTFDPKWSEREILTMLEQTRPEILFIDSSFLSLIDVLPEKIRIVICDELVCQSSMSYQNWLLQWGTEPFYSEPYFINRPFYMGFTSGTTGLPKGFIRNHQSWITSFIEADKELQLQSTDDISVPGPLVHSLFLFAVLYALHSGSTCYLERTFSAGGLKQTLKNNHITVMYGVPTMYEGLFSSLHECEQKDIILEKCIISGDKPSEHKIKEWEIVLPETEWISFYGSSELSFVAILPHVDRYRKEEGIGYPFSTVEVSIRNHFGEELPQGEIGELFARSPMVFSGYHQERVMEKGEWISSGDMVWSEKDGFLNLAGRKKNKIVTGGLNVFPEEVETLLKSHHLVENAAVTGVNDEYWGEKTAALIVLYHHRNIDKEKVIEELKAYCKNNLAVYKCPQRWEITNEIMLTTSGKPARSVMKETLQKKDRDNKDE
ncbi:hypothetical protein D7Z54_24070 [Salibacterium salarium]|uniref:Long-chain acyl-CoA synthetase n=2 Tax=Salibacterium salarium TaxID=284579 RepID=A0A428MXK1_9BACI|nr:hypothetical protein D7Z54_24070 [Salibacterium salarium]